MHKSKIIPLFLVLCLSACTTMKSAEAQKEEIKRKTVAGINIQLGMAYLEDKEMQRAKEKFLLALDDGPSLPESHYSMGYFYETIGDPEHADQYYQKAIALDPHRGDSQNNYGTFLCRHQQFKPALLHFNLALNDPKYLDTAGANENAGLCAQQIPDKKLAYNYFEHAVMQDPNRPVSLFNLAKLNYEIGKFQASQEELDLYLSIAKANAETDKLQANLSHKI